MLIPSRAEPGNQLVKQVVLIAKCQAIKIHLKWLSVCLIDCYKCREYFYMDKVHFGNTNQH